MKIKMISKDDIIKIIKQKGIGKYLGKFIDNGVEKERYSADVKMSLKNNGEYFVAVYLNLPSSFPVRFKAISYEGFNESEAERIFNLIIEKDKRDKQNLVHRLFNKN